MSQLLVTFFSSHVAMETELVMEEAGLQGRLIPLPPAIHAGCGLALLCDGVHREAVLDLMAARRLPYEALYAGHPGSWQEAP